jgi:hypothetical protein
MIENSSDVRECARDGPLWGGEGGTDREGPRHREREKRGARATVQRLTVWAREAEREERRGGGNNWRR